MKKKLGILLTGLLLVSMPLTLQAYQPLFYIMRGWQTDVKGFKNMIMVDKETMVNYIIIDNGKSIAIVPRYNEDGTLYTGE